MRCTDPYHFFLSSVTSFFAPLIAQNLDQALFGCQWQILHTLCITRLTAYALAYISRITTATYRKCTTGRPFSGSVDSSCRGSGCCWCCLLHNRYCRRLISTTGLLTGNPRENVLTWPHCKPQHLQVLLL